jgi:hypothetical protein
MANSARAQAISHQTVRLGAGRHPRPGKLVCVMELASMLAGERFGDRPVSVCPVIGAILRAYNDNVDDGRRQDLYRFAADAVDTRRDFRVQRRRAEAALEWARARYQEHSTDKLPAEPDPEGARDEIAFYVVRSLARRGQRRSRWSDESHASIIALLDELIQLDGETATRPLIKGPLVAQPALDTLLDERHVRETAFEMVLGGGCVGADVTPPLMGQLLEQAADCVEHGSGGHQVLLAERLEGRTEPRLEACTVLLDQLATAVGEGREDHAAVALGSGARDEAGRLEAVEHLGDARRAAIGGVSKVASRHLTLVAKVEQQAVLRVTELARAVGLAPAQPSHRRHRSLERSRELLGGIALLALAYHVAQRG